MTAFLGVTMGPLAEFLLARINEDQDDIRSAVEAQEAWPYGNPERFWAECLAKRQLIRRARRALKAGDIALQTFGGEEPHHRAGRASYIASSMAWQNVLRLLALPYADHPDYREEWKP